MPVETAINIAVGLVCLFAGLSAWFIVPYRVGRVEKDLEKLEKEMTEKIGSLHQTTSSRVDQIHRRITAGEQAQSEISRVMTEVRKDTEFIKLRLEELIAQRGSSGSR